MDAIQSARVRLLLSVVLCGLMSLAVACGDSDEADDASTNGGTTSTNGGTTSTNGGTTSTNSGTTVPPGVSACGEFKPNTDLETPEACAECIDAQCCDEAAACRDNADCFALRECFDACPEFDRGCTNACEAALFNETAGEGNAPYLACRNASCADVCLRKVNWTCADAIPPVPATSPGTFNLQVAVTDFQTGRAVTGGTVRACAPEDIACAEPLVEGEISAGGVIDLDIPVGTEAWTGFLEVQATGQLPTIMYLSAPLDGDRQTTFSVLSQSTLGAFGGILGVAQDPERGALVSFSFDCSLFRARGVALAAASGDAQTRPGYLVGGLPSPAATATDSSGTGGIFNVPAGVTEVTATDASTGQTVDAHEAVFRAGWITSVTFNPSRG